MIDRETEFRNAFYFMKRWTKSPLMSTYTHGYTAGLADKKPAQKVYDFILALGNDKSKSFEDKVGLLDEFLKSEAEAENGQMFSSSGYYYTMINYIKRSLKDIDNGVPVQKKRP